MKKSLSEMKKSLRGHYSESGERTIEEMRLEAFPAKQSVTTPTVLYVTYCGSRMFHSRRELSSDRKSSIAKGSKIGVFRFHTFISEDLA